jgi:hypothetical protein
MNIGTHVIITGLNVSIIQVWVAQDLTGTPGIAGQNR